MRAWRAPLLWLLQNECQRFDMFFMIPVCPSKLESALGSAEYTHKLYRQNGNDERLVVYIPSSALPGSWKYCSRTPKFGYRLFAHTLEEHRARLSFPNWKDVLSYETVWMTRDEIAGHPMMPPEPPK